MRIPKWWIFIILISTSLLTSVIANTTQAVLFRSSHTVSSYGLIEVKSPVSSPTLIPEYSATNLAPMFQGGTNKWGDYHLFGDVYYGRISNPQITHVDKTVLHNRHWTIRVDGPRTIYNGAREVNEYPHSVRVGDRVVFKMWMKTSPSSIGSGAIFGFDCFGKDRILEVTKRVPDQKAIWNYNNGHPIQGGTAVYVPYGSDWTQVTIDVIIPDFTYTFDDGGKPLPHGEQKISSIHPWITGSWNQNEAASVWFADAELYINP